MCALQYWVNKKEGFIATCNQCNALHLAYGTTMVVINEALLKQIQRQLFGLLSEGCIDNENAKFTAVSTGKDKTFFVLTYAEVVELNAMIDDYFTETTAAKMIQLLENG